MKVLKKFSKRSMRKAIVNAMENMSEEDAYTTCAGMYNLFKIMNKYYEDRYNSAKRIDDLYEYVTILQEAYLKKGSK